MNVREIVFPRIRGVYLLADLLHQRAVTSSAWLCSRVYYVGKSNDVAVAIRLLGHRSGKHGRKSFVNDPRMILLAETNEGNVVVVADAGVAPLTPAATPAPPPAPAPPALASLVPFIAIAIVAIVLDPVGVTPSMNVGWRAGRGVDFPGRLAF